MVWRKAARIRNGRTEWKGLTNHPNPSVADGKDREPEPTKELDPNNPPEAYTGRFVGRKPASHLA